MRAFRPLILLAGIALTASAALAQPPPPPPADGPAWGPGGRHGEHDKGDWEARREKMAERRFAELHAKLDIQPAQEAAWTAFVAELKAARPPRPPRPEGEKPEWNKPKTTPEAMDHMLAREEEMHASLVKMDAAVKTFYAVLSKDQKTIFDDNFHHMHGPGGWGHGPGGHGGPGGPPQG
jgi:hypothetical protein